MCRSWIVADSVLHVGQIAAEDEVQRAVAELLERHARRRVVEHDGMLLGRAEQQFGRPARCRSRRRSPTLTTTRLTWSESVQFSSRPVMNSLLGTMNSLRSQLVIVVARMRIRETTPVTSPTVTTSPTRIGRSKRMIRPETKLAKISCRPKPRPTLIAATSHWTLSQLSADRVADGHQADDGDHVARDGADRVADAGVEAAAAAGRSFPAGRGCFWRRSATSPRPARPGRDRPA